MTVDDIQPFATLLKRFRQGAGLSQEELAERAGVSTDAISALERGVNRKPHMQTVRQIAEALELGADQRTILLAAARPAQPAAPVEQQAAGSSAIATDPAFSTPPRRHNLPEALTSLVGREREVLALVTLLQQSEHRLLTLTGIGGVGKTRLALAVATAVLASYPDGVWLVELAALQDPDLVVGTVLAALGVRGQTGRSSWERLEEHLCSQCLLLVLDNCEHLILACATLAEGLLRACPRLQVLATSREGLAVAGERLYQVPSLTVPDPQHLPPAELVGSYEAVRLFVTRAQSRRAAFALTERNAQAVAEVCARLDGIPLALELAAARIVSLSVEGIAARLDDRFLLLTGGSRTALPRQQTLRAALDWSHELLSTEEQLLLRRLAVFAGGWSLSAAEAVCAGAGLPERTVLDLVDGLVQKSLVQVEDDAEGQIRYGLLETVRHYGWERLAASGEEPVCRKHHLDWCLALAEQAEPALRGAEQGAWLDRLEDEHDNLRAALHWSIYTSSDRPRGLQLAAALASFWDMHGHLSEGRRWLEEALGLEGAVPWPLRARALNGAGTLAWRQGDFSKAATLFEGSLILRRKLGDLQGIASVLANLGLLALVQDEYDRAGTLLEECLSLFRQLDNTPIIARLLGNLGIIAWRKGNYGRARALYQESLVLSRQVGDLLSVANTLGNLGEVAAAQGDYELALTLYDESLALFRELRNTFEIATSLGNQGDVAAAQGAYDRARVLYEESLALFRELENTHGIADSLNRLAYAATAQGAYERATMLLAESLTLTRGLGATGLAAAVLESAADLAAVHDRTVQATRLLGAADALRTAIGAPLPPTRRTAHERMVASVHTARGNDAFTMAWTAGQALSLEQALDEALTLVRALPS